MKQEIIAELERIRSEAGGVLRPAEIVDAAEDEASPLHECFTWDDTKAAHNYRLWQARHLLKVCVTVVHGAKHPVQMYVSLKTDREDDGGYRALVDVMSDDDMREQLLDEAMDELRFFQRKYKQLKELAPVFEAMKKVGRKHSKVSA